MEVTWAQVANSALPLLGVVVGGIATYFTQTQLFNKQQWLEREKERYAEQMERLTIYSEILKIEGQTLMSSYTSSRQGAQFNLKAYRKDIRPLFYSKFHLLHEEIAVSIRRMDGIILEGDFFEEIGDKDNDKLINIFNKMIKDVEINLRENRNS